MKKSIRGFFIIWLTGILSAPSAFALERTDIRVAILKDTPDAVMSIRGRYTILDSKTKTLLEEGHRREKARVLPKNNGIYIGKNFYAAKQITIVPERDVSLYLPKGVFRYEGKIDVINQDNNELLIINELDVESYVKGVVYHEVTDEWPMESMKAQAVAARTYALYQMKKNETQPYDVTGDIYSQVFGGRSAERYRTNLAVNKTMGEVLTYHGEIIPAYFHANCGGHTEDASELWQGNWPYLKGVECDYCRTGKAYTWKKNFRAQEVADKLIQHGYKIDSIKDIKVLERNESGRIRNLEIETRDGRKVIIAGKRFRDIIGPNVIRSNKYEIEMQGYYFDLSGLGWGHGVGMCQWGAHEMGWQRYLYQDILKFYYPGVNITKYETR